MSGRSTPVLRPPGFRQTSERRMPTSARPRSDASYMTSMRLPVHASARCGGDGLLTRAGKLTFSCGLPVQVGAPIGDVVEALLDEEAIRQHHEALSVPCGDVHRGDSLL